jgi:hypothetical protein
MVTCFDDPLQVMKNAYDNMKPGGWIEYQDGPAYCTSVDGTHHGTSFALGSNLLALGGAARGRDFLSPIRYKEYLAEAGFVDITEQRLLMPMGGWPKDPKMRELGRYMGEDSVLAARSMGKLLRLSGMTDEQVENLPWACRQELNSGKHHFVWPM